jgi:hypothetical protein
MCRCLAVLLLVFSCLAGAQTVRVIYPRHPAEHDPQLDYIVAVLKLALDKSGRPYVLKQSEAPMVQSRVIEEIARNSGKVDIVWTMTSEQREKDLLPIRIPIDFGLIGWRVALVRADRTELFGKVRRPEDLARLVAGQMHDWPDTAILRANGLQVITSSHYEGLFSQLLLGRVDYFPRSVIEVRSELKAHPQLTLAIEPHLLLRYPTAFYFFVSRQRPELAHTIETGLWQALGDGSLDKLFRHYFGNVVNDLQLNKRRVIELRNPLLPAATPLQDRRLWFDMRSQGLPQAR